PPGPPMAASPVVRPDTAPSSPITAIAARSSPRGPDRRAPRPGPTEVVVDARERLVPDERERAEIERRADHARQRGIERLACARAAQGEGRRGGGAREQRIEREPAQNDDRPELPHVARELPEHDREDDDGDDA